MNDSRASPSHAREAGEQVADQRRVAARNAAGAHRASHEELPEVRTWRRAPSVRLDVRFSPAPLTETWAMSRRSSVASAPCRPAAPNTAPTWSSRSTRIELANVTLGALT